MTRSRHSELEYRPYTRAVCTSSECTPWSYDNPLYTESPTLERRMSPTTNILPAHTYKLIRVVIYTAVDNFEDFTSTHLDKKLSYC